MAGSCKRGNESFGSVRCGKLLNTFSEWNLLQGVSWLLGV
jgi:hypothetical protein